MYTTSLMVFRRDLRLEDNTALFHAAQQSQNVVACFLFDERQIGSNAYKSERGVSFLVESVRDLQRAVREKGGELVILRGEAEKDIRRFARECGAQAVFVNKDYTPFSKARDEALRAELATHGIEFHAYDDALLHAPEETVKSDGKPYGVFTPFYKHVISLPKRAILKAPHALARTTYSDSDAVLASVPTVAIELPGGRTEAMKRLHRAARIENYDNRRDLPSESSTSRLSAYLKFGCVSPREVREYLEAHMHGHVGIVRELVWRDFFTVVAHFHPRVFGHAYESRFDSLEWDNDEEKFQRWCNGNTGFPIVDAGMRELNETGFMHNRARLITASFLTKDLHIDWRWGEKYFAQKLLDYDPAVNNGNWQWVAGTGCDAQPYFRIFNPWLQQKKFDVECAYIKRFVPELAEVPVETIHAWHDAIRRPEGHAYPEPIVDHASEAARAKEIFGRANTAAAARR